MSNKGWIIFISDCAEASLIFVALLCIILNNKRDVFRLLKVYVVLMAGLTLLSTVLAYLEVHNWFVYNIIGLVDLIFAYCLYRKLGTSFYWKHVFIACLVFYILHLFWVFAGEGLSFAGLTPDAPLYINNLGLGLTYVFSLSLGLNFLYNMYREEYLVEISRYPEFFLNGGFMLYSAASILFYFSSILTIQTRVDVKIFHYTWLLMSIFLLVKSILIARAVIIEYKCPQN